MNDITLNLTRKWRSKTFDQIIGQPLSVKMLKNSLYVGHYFPVYLFAGQRGCGKTTTARVFAAAINCFKLENFKLKPKEQQLPCLECDSCIAMQDGKHPDFIEMDAASHTGVDNVREIIEAASLLPILGNKKIYLIDEAHMLSKAAFNAFLKILEEPPKSVVFIMATTDPHKIPETVRSRCFQLFFRAVVSDDLLGHLKAICSRELIKAEDEALKLIIKESEGSVRDAMNMLEQVRFSNPVVTKAAVHSALGYLDEQVVVDLVVLIVEADTANILNLLKKNLNSNTNAQSMWHGMVEVLRAILWAKYDVKHETYENLYQDFKQCARKLHVKQINGMLGLLFENELLFLKSTVQIAFVEVMIMRMVELVHGVSEEPRNQIAVDYKEAYKESSVENNRVSAASEQELATDLHEDIPQEEVVVTEAVTVRKKVASSWDSFIAAINLIQEPMLISLFKQATCTENIDSHEIKLSLPQNFSMFEEVLNEQKDQWQPILNTAYGAEMKLIVSFDKVAQVIKKKVEPVAVVQPERRPQKTAAVYKEKLKGRIDISDKETWRTANALMDAFGGTVVEITEDHNE